MELNNLIFKKCIKFITEINLIHHLLSAYVYVNEKTMQLFTLKLNNHRNGLIYILMHIKIKKIKCGITRDWVTIVP